MIAPVLPGKTENCPKDGIQTSRPIGVPSDEIDKLQEKLDIEALAKLKRPSATTEERKCADRSGAVKAIFASYDRAQTLEVQTNQRCASLTLPI